MKLEQGQKLLFIGDSITDTERAKPVGEGLFNALGRGYVSLVDAFLQSAYPELGIRVVNKGQSGNTVRDLRGRWQEDVIDQKPDWLVVMIGINDVWRQFDVPYIKDWHVYEDEYERTLRELVKESKPAVKGLVLMTPFFIESNEKDAMRAKMDVYGHIVRKIAAEYNCYFIDTQAAFNRMLNVVYSGTLSWDRVHPTLTGHMVLARTFLSAIGFDWSKNPT